MGLLTLLCIWNAFSDFRAAATMRHVKAKAVAANLTIDWGRTEESSSEEPLYRLVVELVAMDESKRVFHFEGDPGQAVYPEEAMDSLERFAVGTGHTVSMLRGNARELRFDQFESNPEITKGIAWSFGAVFAALIGIAAYVAMDKVGPWIVFFGFGLLPLLGAIPVGWGASHRIMNWKQVTAQNIGEPAPFDVTKSRPNVQITPRALENLPQHPYQRIEFQWQGRTLHGGLGPFRGIYDTDLPTRNLTFFMNPNDRWEIDESLTWGEDFAFPTGILALFGIVFTGVGLLIRRGF